MQVMRGLSNGFAPGRRTLERRRFDHQSRGQLPLLEAQALVLVSNRAVGSAGSSQQMPLSMNLVLRR